MATTAGPAEAAPRPLVKIKKIKTKTAPYEGKALVKPVVRVRGQVKVLSKTLTVKRGKKVITRNRAKVRLNPGTYRVKTRVKFQRWTVVDGVREYSTVKTRVKSQKLKVKAGQRPNRTDPISTWDCPSWAPIKGNGDSMIYHMPEQSFYDRTKPEECFRTEGAAVAAGYRKSKV
ncbi:hypothetical protein FE697_017445 [Mumia zhuanghuii]|uniref:Uncharacterized protein n=2 Tax=Mumia TaxID=1546255 RepID=A0ABW1QMZ4_9ACTN|nr:MULTISPECIES: hypothetical protein [Mumia]KAA1420722.1 hypothetical protein FE697_017445 [Mumia zhuanghuii]